MPNSLVNSRMVKLSRPVAPASKLAARSGIARLGLRPDRRSELKSGFMGLLACVPGRAVARPRRHIADVYVNVKPFPEKLFRVQGAKNFDLGQSAASRP